jgi:hypothetical protein
MLNDETIPAICWKNWRKKVEKQKKHITKEKKEKTITKLERRLLPNECEMTGPMKYAYKKII